MSEWLLVLIFFWKTLSQKNGTEALVSDGKALQQKSVYASITSMAWVVQFYADDMPKVWRSRDFRLDSHARILRRFIDWRNTSSFASEPFLLIYVWPSILPLSRSHVHLETKTVPVDVSRSDVKSVGFAFSPSRKAHGQSSDCLLFSLIYKWWNNISFYFSCNIYSAVFLYVMARRKCVRAYPIACWSVLSG